MDKIRFLNIDTAELVNERLQSFDILRCWFSFYGNFGTQYQ